MKICEGLWLIGSGNVGLSDPCDCNVYLVDAGDEYVLIDAGVGPGVECICSNLRKDGIDPARISTLLITHHHSDHAGAAAAWKRAYGLRVYAPLHEAASIEMGDEKVLGLDIARRAGYYPADYRFMPCEVDVRVEVGQRIVVGNRTFTAFDGAGHSLGGLCYLCEIDGKQALFVGDMLAAGGRVSLQNIPGISIERYSASVLALENVPVDMFLPGHGLFCISGGSAHVRKAAEAFRQLGVPPNAV